MSVLLSYKNIINHKQIFNQGIPECYEDIQNILNTLNFKSKDCGKSGIEITKFDFCVNADLKLQNIILGLTDCTNWLSMCLYCQSLKPFENIGELKTLKYMFFQIKKKLVNMGRWFCPICFKSF